MNAHKVCLLALASLFASSAWSATGSVTETAPTGGTSIDFGSSVISPPASVTFGDATFSGGAFLLPDPGVYGGTAATPPGSSDFWSIGVSGANGSVGSGSISFAQGISNLSFEWGSPDAYNTITFYDKGGHDLGSFTGTYVQANGPSFGLGDQTVTRYFSFSSPTDPIFSVAMTSPTNAFETANYSYVSAVPEPETYLYLFAGLGILSVVVARKHPPKRRSTIQFA